VPQYGNTLGTSCASAWKQIKHLMCLSRETN